MNTPLPSASPAARAGILFLVILGVIVASFSFAVWHHDDNDARIRFSLINHQGDPVSERDLGGRHLLVFFGFTSCHTICPTQMQKITRVMADLGSTGHGTGVQPVFISVDPERDSPEKIASYLTHFDERFVGLTGSRPALQSAANSFKTLLQAMREGREDGYQITHSSLTYIVDPFGRVIGYVPGATDSTAFADKVRTLL